MCGYQLLVLSLPIMSWRFGVLMEGFFGDRHSYLDCRGEEGLKNSRKCTLNQTEGKLVQQDALHPALSDDGGKLREKLWAEKRLKGGWLVRVRRCWRRKRRMLASGCWALGYCSFPESCFGDGLAGCLVWNQWLVYGQTRPLEQRNIWLKLVWSI